MRTSTFIREYLKTRPVNPNENWYIKDYYEAMPLRTVKLELRNILTNKRNYHIFEDIECDNITDEIIKIIEDMFMDLDLGGQQAMKVNSISYNEFWKDPCLFDFSPGLQFKNFERLAPKIKKVIFNEPATIVIWNDGSKTVVKVKEGERFDKWTGLAMCHMKKQYGDKFHSKFSKWCKEDKS